MERSVALEAGVSTRVTQWGERGPLVLCVHGITSSRLSWQRLGERLMRDVRVVAYDQRAHGDSAHVAGPMTLERSVRDLEAVNAMLGEPADLLVGHSWGGAVAVLGGRASGARRVIAIDPMLRVAPGSFEADYVDDLRDTFALEGDAREAAIRAMYEGSHPQDVAAKVHAMRAMRIEGLERLGRENAADAGGWDVRESVRDYPVRLDILAAGVESVLSPDDLAFVEHHGGPNVTLVTFAGEGHNLQRTAFDAFAEIVRRKATGSG